MSEGRNNQPQRIANSSWLFSEPANRAIARCLVNPSRVAEETIHDIRENVRKNLEHYYSREESLGPNVITEREFSFRTIDPELIAPGQTYDSDVESAISASRLTHRREFSLISYDSSIFNPSEIYHAMNPSKTR